MPVPGLFTCTVDSAGPFASAATPNLPADPVFLTLTDLGGAFQQRVYYAADSIKREILAVALTAISTQRQVGAFVAPPDPREDPREPSLTECYALGVIVSGSPFPDRG